MRIAKDGHDVSIGMFGDGLAWAVHGVPDAEAEANAYRAESMSGYATAMSGVVVGTSGLVLAIGVASKQIDGPPASSADQRATAAGVGISLIGLGAVFAGALVMGLAQRHAWNAINRYNDALPVSPTPAPATPR